MTPTLIASIALAGACVGGICAFIGMAAAIICNKGPK